MDTEINTKNTQENLLIQNDNNQQITSMEIESLKNDFPAVRRTPEVEIHPKSGCCFLLINIISFCVSAVFIGVGAGLMGIDDSLLALFIILLLLGVIGVIVSAICFCGYFTNDPGYGTIITFYGKYKGTVKDSGFFWINPLTGKQSISMRANTFNGTPVKVNDKVGNPIMMACTVVWRVKDSARATFDVENYQTFVANQSESAVRYVGCMYPYDKTNENEICLRSGHEEVNKVLKEHLTQRLVNAGIEVEEARITELAYASEIANAMLKRQAAEAIIAAREKIVQGAVSIVGHAINSLKTNDICELNREEKSRLVSNMLVVLCSDSQVNPVVNTGAS